MAFNGGAQAFKLTGSIGNSSSSSLPDPVPHRSVDPRSSPAVQ